LEDQVLGRVGQRSTLEAHGRRTEQSCSCEITAPGSGCSERQCASDYELGHSNETCNASAEQPSTLADLRVELTMSRGGPCRAQGAVSASDPALATIAVECDAPGEGILRIAARMEDATHSTSIVTRFTSDGAACPPLPGTGADASVREAAVVDANGDVVIDVQTQADSAPDQ